MWVVTSAGSTHTWCRHIIFSIAGQAISLISFVFCANLTPLNRTGFTWIRESVSIGVLQVVAWLASIAKESARSVFMADKAPGNVVMAKTTGTRILVKAIHASLAVSARRIAGNAPWEVYFAQSTSSIIWKVSIMAAGAVSLIIAEQAALNWLFTSNTLWEIHETAGICCRAQIEPFSATGTKEFEYVGWCSYCN